MTTVVSILMSDLVSLSDRGLWQGIINIVYATGAGIGAPLGKGSWLLFRVSLSLIVLLGGMLADYIGWRWYVILC